MIRTSPLVFDKNKFRTTGVKNVFPTIVAPINMDGATTNVERRDRELRQKRIAERRNAGIEEDLSGIADRGYLASDASTGKTGNISAASRIIMGRKQIDARSYNKVLNAINEVQRRRFLNENRKLLQYLSEQAELTGIPLEMRDEIRGYLRLTPEERDPYSANDFRTQHIYEFVAPMLSQWRNVLTPQQEVALENDLHSQLKQDYAEQIAKLTGQQPTAKVLEDLVPELVRLNQNFQNFLQQAPAQVDGSTVLQQRDPGFIVDASKPDMATNTPALHPAPSPADPVITTEPAETNLPPAPPLADVPINFNNPIGQEIYLPGAEPSTTPVLKEESTPLKDNKPQDMVEWYHLYGPGFIESLAGKKLPATFNIKSYVKDYAEEKRNIEISNSFASIYDSLTPKEKLDIRQFYRTNFQIPQPTRHSRRNVATVNE